MFAKWLSGGVPPPPKDCRRKRPQPMKNDIQFPSPTPAYYMHFAREPNTNYNVQQTEWQFKRDSYVVRKEEAGKKALEREMLTLKYGKHAEKRQFQRMIRDKVALKIKEYEDGVDERRKRLEELLCEEELAYIRETVETAQKQEAHQMEEMKKRAELLRARREEERLKVVHEKRIEQYKTRCQNLRPLLEKKHLMEAKHTQLQQMRENEARREAEKELDRMWHELTMKEVKAKMEREEQERLAQNKTLQSMMESWNMQIKGKELLKAEVEKIAHEDRIEMLKLSDQLRREEIEALDAKRKKRDQTARELIEQVAEQEALFANRKKEADALDQAYVMLTELEIEREKQAVTEHSATAKKETALYRKHLKELDEERRKEEKELQELLEMHRKEVEKQQDEAKCKVIEAKRQLQRGVLQGRAEQIAHKQQEAEQQLKLKQAENELLQMMFEQNERLQAESDRLQAEAVRQYRDDLLKQIQYRNTMREREQQELERQLREGVKEEERYQKLVEDMLTLKVESGQRHPFRKVLERYNCHCASDVP